MGRITMNTHISAIEMAEHQMIGFMEGVTTGDIIALIKAQGLRKAEWEEIKCRNGHTLRPKDIRLIDNYFNTK